MFCPAASKHLGVNTRVRAPEIDPHRPKCHNVLVSRWQIGLAFPELVNAVAGAEAHGGVYHFDEFRLDVERGTLHGRGESVLTVRPKAFALLRFLVENPGRLHGRAELLETLWPDVVVTDDSLTQCISDLRHAFGDRAPHVLKTVPRHGYMLTAEVWTETTAPEPPQPPPSDRRVRAHRAC